MTADQFFHWTVRQLTSHGITVVGGCFLDQTVDPAGVWHDAFIPVSRFKTCQDVANWLGY